MFLSLPISLALGQRRPQVGGGNLFLDGRTDVVAGYSLRRISSAYNGPLVNVRRSTDNATQDFYALPSGFLDMAAANAFIGGGNGFVTKFFEQTTNARHLIQATASLQPKLITASNNRPALLFDGIDDTMNTATGFVVAQPDSFNFCYRQVAVLQPSLQNAFDSSVSPDQQTLYNSTAGTWQNRLYAGIPGGIIDVGVSMPVGTRGAVGGTYNRSTSLVAVNAATIATLADAQDVGGNSQNGLTLGMRLATTSRADNIEVQEFVWFNTGHNLVTLAADNASIRAGWNF